MKSKPHRGKACCVFVLGVIFAVSPGIARRVACVVTWLWPDFKGR